MRNLLKMMLMGTLVVGLSSCGGDSNSSGRSTSLTNFGTSDGDTFTEFTALRNTYTSSSFSSGLTAETAVYHIGPLYGGSFNTTSSNFAATFCVGSNNIFGNDDRCQGSISGDSQLNDIVDRGEYKVIRSATSSAVQYGLANGVSNGTFTFSESSFDRNDSIFRRMLNLDDVATRRVVVSDAFIQLSDRGQVNANLVEFFFEDGRYESYILSSALPLVANPVASYSGNYTVGGGVSFNLEGTLSFIGQASLTGVSAQPHMLRNDFQTGQLTVVNTNGRIQ